MQKQMRMAVAAGVSEHAPAALMDCRRFTSALRNDGGVVILQ
jgi:hypothetical protein